MNNLTDEQLSELFHKTAFSRTNCTAEERIELNLTMIKIATEQAKRRASARNCLQEIRDLLAI